MKTTTINLIFLFFIFSLLSCTFTTTKSKNPVIDNIDGLKTELTSIVTAEKINLTGKEITTNGKTKSQLEISITNGQNIPQEDDFRKLLSRQIAKHVKSHLKDSTEFDFFNVVFVAKQQNGVLTKNNSILYGFTAAEVNTPYLNVGKQLTSKNGAVFGGSVFTNKDSEIICVLTDYTFVDTSAVFLRLFKKVNGSEEKLGESHVTVNPEDNYLIHRMSASGFYDAYGDGKFIFQVCKHDTIIASRDFQVRQE